MDLKSFFKPTKWTVILFVVLIVFAYLFFASVPLKVFSCQTQPVVPNPPPFKDDVCSLWGYFGAMRMFTFSGYLMMFLVLVVLPYVVACAINSLIRRK